jgi:hypothetical protein
MIIWIGVLFLVYAQSFSGHLPAHSVSSNFETGTSWSPTGHPTFYSCLRSYQAVRSGVHKLKNFRKSHFLLPVSMMSSRDQAAIDDLFRWATENGAEISNKLILQGEGNSRRILTTEDIAEGEQVVLDPLHEVLLNILGSSNHRDDRYFHSLLEPTSLRIGSVSTKVHMDSRRQSRNCDKTICW